MCNCIEDVSKKLKEKLGDDELKLQGVVWSLETAEQKLVSYFKYRKKNKAGVLFGNNLPAIKKYIKENNELDLLGDKSGIKIFNFKPFQFDEMRLELENIKSIKE